MVATSKIMDPWYNIGQTRLYGAKKHKEMINKMLLKDIGESLKFDKNGCYITTY